MRKNGQRNRHQENRKYRDGSPPPALLPFAKDKWQQQQPDDYQHRTNQQSRSFHGGRQKRKHRIEPQEKEIRPGSCLDNRGIGRSRRPEGTKVIGACANRKQYKGGEEHILPNRARKERHTVLLSELVVFLYVCRL